MEGQTKKILLAVDDEPMQLKVIRLRLRDRTDIEIRTAANADDAMKIASQGVDGILSDYEMGPEGNGVWLLNKLIERGIISSENTCLITGNSGGARKDGWKGKILEKPVSGEVFLRTVDDILGLETEQPELPRAARLK